LSVEINPCVNQGMTDSSFSSEAIAKSRGWFIAGGILLWITGFVSIVYPEIASLAIVQLVGALLLVSGVVSLFLAVFGKHTSHRVIQFLLGLIRLAAGALLLVHVVVGLLALTLLLAAVFLVEGVFSIVTAFRVKGHRGWGWLLFNGVVTLLLAVLLYIHFPSAADWAIGLLFGINAIFGGTSLLMLGAGTAAPKS